METKIHVPNHQPVIVASPTFFQPLQGPNHPADGQAGAAAAGAICGACACLGNRHSETPMETAELWGCRPETWRAYVRVKLKVCIYMYT